MCRAIAQIALHTAPEVAQTTAVITSPLFRSLTGLVLAGIALYLLSWAAPVAAPIFFALYLTAILSLLYQWLMDKGLKKGLVLLLLIAGILGAGVAVS